MLGGLVQRRTNQDLTVEWAQTSIDGLRFARERPGSGYRHLARRADVERFVRLLPQWDELSVGLDAVVLAAGEPNLYGYFRAGIVAICAWPKEPIEFWPTAFLDEHASLLPHLDVELEEIDEDGAIVRFTEASALAFQLMHVLLHELGHHHDRMTTASKRSPARGEPFANTYAFEHAEKLWDAYYREFPY
ncbi:MAG: hypothetical protein AAGB93_01195 [Planctomycetota bacterium]